MDKLISKFLNNEANYSSKLDELLREAMNKNFNLKDFSTILLILGQKYLSENKFDAALFISTILIRLQIDRDLLLTKEHIQFIETIEKNTNEKKRKFSNKMLFMSILLAIGIFLLLRFIGKISLEISVIITVTLLLGDIFLLRRNRERMFFNILMKDMKNKIDENTWEFIERHVK